MAQLLLLSVFVISTCGLIYELIAAALASYLLGDSITQFSTVIGVYLFSMGIGSYLSKFLNKNLLEKFIQIEILIGVVGGFSASILFVSFEYVTSFKIILYSLLSLTGILVGVEIPLLMRILQTHFEFKDLVSKIFTFDYIGALIASIMFPLFLVPHLGFVKTAFLFGIINLLVAVWTLTIFKDKIKWINAHRLSAIFFLLVLAVGFVESERIVSFAESASFQDNVIYAKSTKYQRIVLTKSTDDFRLFLNGNLQFSSKDEYRYHEALVHVGLASIPNPKKVLILGGGDGLAVREVLKYPSVENITLVDLDPEMTKLFSTNTLLTTLNHNALNSSKVKVINTDAFLWLKENQEKFDFVIVDFPDPSNYSIGKLYTNTFYKLLKRSIAEGGLGVVQSTSPYVAKKSYWCIDNTLKSVGFLTTPYHAYVPAFGDWGYILFSTETFVAPEKFPENLKFITADVLHSLMIFPEDMIVQTTEVNKLNNQVLVKHFEEEWANYAH
ncbi:polyamine aminopropyltransferase [Bacteriovorax stolpii]|uniref:polyamine aminopropyltransferase n=1 Tax=Bacteriovorax stolpii TaxID=960 RepID=UPI00115B87B1|nr:polyamine aminopropyltransferase [Bacteriovorax stolpii]QDK43171.1 polyamine aminopropyltransferase [Bacteriovorax stolpii]